MRTLITQQGGNVKDSRGRTGPSITVKVWVLPKKPAIAGDPPRSSYCASVMSRKWLDHFMRLVHATLVAFLRAKTNATEVAYTGSVAQLFRGHYTSIPGFRVQSPVKIKLHTGFDLDS